MLVTVLMLHSLLFCSDFSITFFMRKFDSETTVKYLCACVCVCVCVCVGGWGRRGGRGVGGKEGGGGRECLTFFQVYI